MQPATGICPECAAPVARSTRGHYLHHAPPRWVRRQANGALLLVIALCGGLVLWLVVAAAGLAMAASAGGASTVMFEAVLPMLSIIIGVVGLWFIIRGLVQLTTPDPTAQFHHEGFSARKLVRYCLIVLPVSILVLAGLTGLGPWAPLSLLFSLTVTFGIVVAVSGLVYFVLPLATLRHIAMLMRRVPRRGLVIFAKIEFWALLIAGLLYTGSAVLLIASTTTFAPVVGGPNMPAPVYAAGANSPNAVAATSSPALTAPGYTPAPAKTVTYTDTGPGGVTTTTTMPASVPARMAVAPPPGALFFLSTAGMGVSGCSLFGILIAGLVLLILVWRALAKAARLAEAHTARYPTPNEPPQPSP
jgi:hypothetical protein